MSTELKEFYNNDVIYRFDQSKQIVFGMVVDTFKSTDSNYSLPLRKGQIRVNWGKSSEPTRIWPQKKVRLLSRSIIPDDIVRRIEHGKETQRGYCRSVRTVTDVQLSGSNKVIENVAQERLKQPFPIFVGAAVCLDELVGRISSFEYTITLSTKCGSFVEIKTHVNSLLTEDDCFYLGQTIKTKPSGFFKPTWIKQSKAVASNCMRSFFVEKIAPVDVVIEISHFEGNTYIFKVPEEDISRVEVLEIADDYLFLNECHLLKLLLTDTVLTKREWVRKQSSRFWPKDDSLKLSQSSKKSKTVRKVLWQPSWLRSKLKPSLSLDGRTVNTKIKEIEDPDEDDWTGEEEDEKKEEEISKDDGVLQHDCNLAKAKQLGLRIPAQPLCVECIPTIVWQDGSIEEDVPTDQLHQSISLDDHEFFCGEFVINADGTLDKYGVVQKVDYLSRKAMIKWFNVCSMTQGQGQSYSHVAEMSVYDIKKHPVFLFRPFSSVQRNRTCKHSLGYVIDSFPEGFVKVKWIDGQVEDCSPQCISVLPNVISDEMLSDEDDEDSLSWETQSVDSLPSPQIDSITLQNLFVRFEFIRKRVAYIKDIILMEHSTKDTKMNIECFANLMVIYQNLSHVDRFLETSHFSLKDPHYQSLLQRNQELVKKFGSQINYTVDFTKPDARHTSCILSRNRLKEILNDKEFELIASPVDSSAPCLCVELLSMFKSRLDLAFADFIIRMDSQVLILSETEMNITDITTFDELPDPLLPIELEEGNNNISNGTEVISDCPHLSLPYNSSTTQFEVLDEAPCTHQHYKTNFEPVDRKLFFKAVLHENQLLKESLPDGVWVYTFSDRMDLYTIMIRGPDHTPYENGLFIFDLQLSATYPSEPPVCTYISYNTERLNPNLYVEGKVCVSLLGTWTGHGTEVWRHNSTLLQLIVSIQGLILVAEPYYNEAGYDKQCNSQVGTENSRIYNELVLLRLVQSMTEMIENPYGLLKAEIYRHFQANGEKLIKRLFGWINHNFEEGPQFPLLPVSEGLKLSLNASLEKFKKVYYKYLLDKSIS